MPSSAAPAEPTSGCYGKHAGVDAVSQAWRELDEVTKASLLFTKTFNGTVIHD